MHWKGLRLVADGSAKRQSTIEAQPPIRRSEHLPRPHAPVDNPRYSESTPRSAANLPVGFVDATTENGAAQRLQVPTEGSSGPDDAAAPHAVMGSPPNDETPSLRRNRFSFMRLRHASDPQLSKSYAKAEGTPPMPSLPRKYSDPFPDQEDGTTHCVWNGGEGGLATACMSLRDG